MFILDVVYFGSEQGASFEPNPGATLRAVISLHKGYFGSSKVLSLEIFTFVFVRDGTGLKCVFWRLLCP